MKITSKTILLSIALAACASVANAMSISNLAALAGTPGSTLSIGDKVFSNFGYLAVDLTDFDASQIVVEATMSSGVYYLTWSGDISVVAAAGIAATADLKLNYTVTASAGLITMIDQSYTGSAQPTNGAFLSIDETVRQAGAAAPVLANSHLEVGDLSDPFAEIGDNLVLSTPQASVDVTKDIGFGVARGGFVTISEVKQSFHQSVPDGGATVGLLGLALVGVGGLRRKLRAQKA